MAILQKIIWGVKVFWLLMEMFNKIYQLGGVEALYTIGKFSYHRKTVKLSIGGASLIILDGFHFYLWGKLLKVIGPLDRITCFGVLVRGISSGTIF